MGSKHCLLPVVVGDLNLVVARTQVQFGEDAYPVKLIHELLHGGDGKAVSDGNGIQCSIIDAEPLATVFLFHQQYR